jgi:hypothetical protein
VSFPCWALTARHPSAPQSTVPGKPKGGRSSGFHSPHCGDTKTCRSVTGESEWKAKAICAHACLGLEAVPISWLLQWLYLYLTLFWFKVCSPRLLLQTYGRPLERFHASIRWSVINVYGTLHTWSSLFLPLLPQGGKGAQGRAA